MSSIRVGTVMLLRVRVIVILMVMVSSFAAQAAVKPQDPPVVKVIQLHHKKIPSSVIGYGVVKGYHSSQIIAQANGVITGMIFTPGQQVKSGEVIFRLHNNDLENRLSKLKAKTQLSKNYYDRIKKVNSVVHDVTSPYDMLKLKNTYQQDNATYQDAYRLSNIKSPINGVITASEYHVGDYVKEGAVLATVVDNHHLYVQYELPSRYRSKLCTGQNITFYLGNDKTFYRGKVSYISPLLNASDGNIELRAALAQPDNLQENQFGKIVEMLADIHVFMPVPQNLVKTDMLGFYLYIVKHNKVEKYYFKPHGITNAGSILAADIPEDSLIISNNDGELKEGETVRVEKS